ncbi:MAG: hypothetical protein ACRD6X_20285 [Pyrinomonadaceae bacterium]
MNAATANTIDYLNISASPNSSSKDFDFFFGKWKIHNRKLKSRLTNCDEWTEFDAEQECMKILNGFGNQDFFQASFDGEPFEAITMRLFNPKTKLWSIYWVDSKVVVLDVPQVGSFDGDIGEFFARDTWEGTPVIVKFHWDKTNPDSPVWSQAFSSDEGKTWEWNWYMHFRKQRKD